MGIKQKKSFTLIEIIVAVGVVGLILPAIFNIFYALIRQQLVLVAIQEVKVEGDSILKNIKNILQNRAAYITDSGYTATDICPLPLTPVPTYSPDIYIMDRAGRKIHLFFTASNRIASVAADIPPNKTYYLSSPNISISRGEFGFSCYRISEFTPATVSVGYTATKSTAFQDVELPYSFNTRLRNY